MRKFTGEIDYSTTDQRGDGVTDIAAGYITGADFTADNGAQSFSADDQTITTDDTSAQTAAATGFKLPAFTAGTLIATPKGERPVETLEPGCMVQTRDNGIQTVIWTSKRTIGKPTPGAKPAMRPVRISAGALGPGLPEADMVVSPTHRLLLMTEISELYFGESEVLVEAGHLTSRKGISPVDPAAVTYVTIMFENHELVLANGIWTESFQPTADTLRALGPDQTSALLSAAPDLAVAETVNSYRAARKTLKRHEAALLLS